MNHDDDIDHDAIREHVSAAVEQLYANSFEARLRRAVEQLGDDDALALGRAMVRKAGADDTGDHARAFWHELGCFLLDVALDQRTAFDALRIDAELDGDAEGDIVDGG